MHNAHNVLVGCPARTHHAFAIALQKEQKADHKTCNCTTRIQTDIHPTMKPQLRPNQKCAMTCSLFYSRRHVLRSGLSMLCGRPQRVWADGCRCGCGAQGGLPQRTCHAVPCQANPAPLFTCHSKCSQPKCFHALFGTHLALNPDLSSITGFISASVTTQAYSLSSLPSLLFTFESLGVTTQQCCTMQKGQ